ncbi:MAG: hypothetical protein K0Q68_2590 [Moraxellaceae bacterium]|jgi:hypothetical protein|nr:hypothetical protein [Moraxellaceae bacterium]
MNDAALTAVETRTSPPIRIKRRDDNFQSLNTAGLFPAGEGSGYARGNSFGGGGGGGGGGGEYFGSEGDMSKDKGGFGGCLCRAYGEAWCEAKLALAFEIALPDQLYEKIHYPRTEDKTGSIPETPRH